MQTVSAQASTAVWHETTLERLPADRDIQNIVLEYQTYVFSTAIDNDLWAISSADHHVSVYQKESSSPIASATTRSSTPSPPFTPVIRFPVGRESREGMDVDDARLLLSEDVLVVFYDDQYDYSGNATNVVDIYKVTRNDDIITGAILVQTLELLPTDSYYSTAMGTRAVMHNGLLVIQSKCAHVTTHGNSHSFRHPSHDTDLWIWKRNEKNRSWYLLQELHPGAAVTQMALYETTLVLVSNKPQNTFSIYTRDETTGLFRATQQQGIVLNDSLRYEVALYDDVLALAGSARNTGELIIYEQSQDEGQQWDLVARFIMNEESFVEFGTVVALHRNALVVGIQVNAFQFDDGDRAKLYLLQRSVENILPGEELSSTTQLRKSGTFSSAPWKLTHTLESRDKLLRWFSNVGMDDHHIVVVGHGQELNAATYLFEYTPDIPAPSTSNVSSTSSNDDVLSSQAFLVLAQFHAKWLILLGGIFAVLFFTS